MGARRAHHDVAREVSSEDPEEEEAKRSLEAPEDQPEEEVHSERYSNLLNLMDSDQVLLEAVARPPAA